MAESMATRTPQTLSDVSKGLSESKKEGFKGLEQTLQQLAEQLGMTYQRREVKDFPSGYMGVIEVSGVGEVSYKIASLTNSLSFDSLRFTPVKELEERAGDYLSEVFSAAKKFTAEREGLEAYLVIANKNGFIAAQTDTGLSLLPTAKNIAKTVKLMWLSTIEYARVVQSPDFQKAAKNATDAKQALTQTVQNILNA